MAPVASPTAYRAYRSGHKKGDHAAQAATARDGPLGELSNRPHEDVIGRAQEEVARGEGHRVARRGQRKRRHLALPGPPVASSGAITAVGSKPSA
eukprot:217623-Prorocentrum_minimum.AAC.1